MGWGRWGARWAVGDGGVEERNLMEGSVKSPDGRRRSVRVLNKLEEKKENVKAALKMVVKEKGKKGKEKMEVKENEKEKEKRSKGKGNLEVEVDDSPFRQSSQLGWISQIS
jgi:hypothetical protein